MPTSVEDFLYGDNFYAVLVIFHSCLYGTNASETFEKITIDEKDYH